MDFSFSDEQIEFRESVIRFAQGKLNNNFDDSHQSEFPSGKWEALAGQGLLGLCIDEEYGGIGMDCVSAASVLDALGYACLDTGLVHAACTQNLCAVHIGEYGSDEQKNTLLPKICSGELIAAQAISEPDAGSDTAAIRTSAIKSDDGYLLNGSKEFITNGPIADLAIVYAVTAPEKKVLGRTSCLLVNSGAPGFTQGTAYEKMGLHTLKNGELFFSDCQVPNSSLLGREGGGNQMFTKSMQWERVLLFASFIGKLQRVLENCITHVRGRKQFGNSIGSYQAVSHKIAEMKVNLEVGQLVVMKAAWLIDNGKPAALNAAISKLFMSEAVKSACIDAVQIHGGFGYMKEGGIERELRDSVAGTIYSGTSEIQRNIIARLCGV